MTDIPDTLPAKDSVVIRTPDQHLRVFVSSTLKELAEERLAVRRAIGHLHLAPVMFESGARPHPANELYRAYLSQSHIFIGIYWQSYGWVAPGMQVSGLEDEYNLARDKPTLIYVKTPAEKREAGLTRMLDGIKRENASSYKYFSTAEQLEELVENDLMLLLSEYFETAAGRERAPEQAAQDTSSNVPLPRNPLIGREREMAAASDLLLRQDAALVTLAGSAGAGKSRLGIQLARELRGHFKDGAYLVTLESLQDAQLVIPAIAKTLGLTESAERKSLSDTLKAYLAGRQMLLLLDNFEHVLPAAPRIADLLEAAPHTKVIATSRAPLHIRAERELTVAPLALPPRRRDLDAEQLSHYAAVRLFVERAQSVLMDFRLTDENAAAVAEICHRLDGLPLAIELAAARIKMLPPQALLARLGHRLEVLRGDTRDLPPRQRTLYKAIDWSYNLLSEPDKRLLQYLSVFIGGWTLESAEAICQDSGPEPMDVFEGLERLMNNNLLPPSELLHGDVRMKHFETIREFAHEHLHRSDESEAVHERYTRYYLELAARAERELCVSPQQECYERIEDEMGNLRAVMKQAVNAGKAETALQVATWLWRYWWTHGSWSEGLEWLKTGLGASGAIPVALKAKALMQSGWLCRFMGDYPQAVGLLRESVTLWRQAGDTNGLAMALSNLGASMLRQGDAGPARPLVEEALALSRQRGDRAGTYFSLEILGYAASRQGESSRAIELYQESLTLAEQARDDDHVANLLNVLGDEYMTIGDLERAEQHFARAAELSARLGNRFVSAYIAGNRGAIALKKGNYGQAFDLLCKAMSAVKELGDRENTILCLEAFAYVAQGRRSPERATRLLAASEGLRKTIGFVRSQPMQADFDQAARDLAGQLGEAAFAAAWAEGACMTYDQAAAYATDKCWRPEA